MLNTYILYPGNWSSWWQMMFSVHIPSCELNTIYLHAYHTSLKSKKWNWKLYCYIDTVKCSKSCHLWGTDKDNFSRIQNDLINSLPVLQTYYANKIPSNLCRCPHSFNTGYIFAAHPHCRKYNVLYQWRKLCTLQFSGIKSSLTCISLCFNIILYSILIQIYSHMNWFTKLHVVCCAKTLVLR